MCGIEQSQYHASVILMRHSSERNITRMSRGGGKARAKSDIQQAVVRYQHVGCSFRAVEHGP